MATQDQVSEFESRFLPLKKMVEENIERTDYSALIDRWNSYWNVMDQIDATIKEKKIQGVVLRRNLESNLHPQYPHEKLLTILTGAGIIGMLALGLLFAIPAQTAEINKTSWPLPWWTGVAIGLGILLFSIAGWIVAYIKKPKLTVIKVSCAPVLHINELEYTGNIIKGLEKLNKDPEIYLPKLSLEIPREELAKRSSQHMMQLLQSIKLPENF